MLLTNVDENDNIKVHHVSAVAFSWETICFRKTDEKNFLKKLKKAVDKKEKM